MTRQPPSNHFRTVADTPAKRSVAPEDAYTLSPPPKRQKTARTLPANFHSPVKPSSHIASGNKYSRVHDVAEVMWAVKREVGTFRKNSVELLEFLRDYYANEKTDCGSDYPFTASRNLFQSPAQEWCLLKETQQYPPIARFLNSINRTLTTSVGIGISEYDTALIDKSKVGISSRYCYILIGTAEPRLLDTFTLRVKANIMEVLWQVARYARLLKGEDPQRIFTYAVVFHSKCLNFVRVDRGGVVVTRDLKLDDMEDAKIAVDCFLALLSLHSPGRRHHLRGCDFSFSLSPRRTQSKYEFHGSSVIFTIHGNAFSLLQCITWREELRGRATRVFTASAINPPATFSPRPHVDVNGWEVDSGQHSPVNGSGIVILRFVHRLRSRDIEPIIIQEISQFDGKGTPLFGLPKFGPCFVNGHFATKAIRAKDHLDDETGDDRIYTLQIILSVGRPLETASSVREIIVALHDATLGLHQLWRLGFVHRDVSFGNILLYDGSCDVQFYDLTRENEALPASRRPTAFLTDFDVAVRWPIESNAIHHPRTGTPEFMALALLRKEEPSTPHTPVYDLESIFWVLIWAVAHHLQRISLSDAIPLVIDRLQNRKDAIEGRIIVLLELRFKRFGGREHPSGLEKFGDFLKDFAVLVEDFQMFETSRKTRSEKVLIGWIDESFAKVISLFESIESTNW